MTESKNHFLRKAYITMLTQALPQELRSAAETLFLNLVAVMVTNPHQMERILRARSGKDIRAQDLFVFFLETWKGCAVPFLPPSSTSSHLPTNPQQVLQNFFDETDEMFPSHVNVSVATLATASDATAAVGCATRRPPLVFKQPPPIKFSEDDDEDDMDRDHERDMVVDCEKDERYGHLKQIKSVMLSEQRHIDNPMPSSSRQLITVKVHKSNKSGCSNKKHDVKQGISDGNDSINDDSNFFADSHVAINSCQTSMTDGPNAKVSNDTDDKAQQSPKNSFNRKRVGARKTKAKKSLSEFLCPHCGKTLTRKNNLTRHIKESHESDKYYQCHLCDKSYSHGRTLKEHLETDHNDKAKKSTCSFCDKVYVHRQAFLKHVQTHHKVRMHQLTPVHHHHHHHELPKLKRNITRSHHQRSASKL